jgi:hypothetical protein
MYVLGSAALAETALPFGIGAISRPARGRPL